MSTPYRPSNGTEGDMFMSKFCDKCAKCNMHDDDKDPCKILGASMMYNISDPEYPKEWIEDENGPKCTAFIPEGQDIPDERCSETLDMFHDENDEITECWKCGGSGYSGHDCSHGHTTRKTDLHRNN